MVKGIRLDDKQMALATFIVNVKVAESQNRLQQISGWVKELKESLQGGERGDAINETMDSIEAFIAKQGANFSAISKYLNTKLGKVIEANKDNDNIRQQAEAMLKAVASNKLNA